MRSLGELKRLALRTAGVMSLMLMVVLSVSAYTLVLRDGRRLEIPAHFVVTSTTLTYEVSQGVQVSMQLALIDVPATERANGEAPGALARRGKQAAPVEDQKIGIPNSAARTITNRELESSARRRQQSETAYEVRRRQLGLPSVEETRRQAAIAEASFGAELREKISREKEDESYWRGRASDLRTEMAALDEEISYLRVQLEDGPLTAGVTSFTTILPFGYGTSSFGGFAGGPFRGGGGPHHSRVYMSPDRSRSFGGSMRRGPGFGLGTPGGLSFGRLRTNRPGFPSYGDFPYGYQSGFATVAPFEDYSYERSELITRFNELAAARAALNARWRALEDEARRAGAPPGWLRP
jgi:hypothetical protein